MEIKDICIFASASNEIDKKYFEIANELGKKLAQNNYNIVFGGSELGLMGEFTKAAFDNGARVTGVMPEKLYQLGIKEGACTKFIITKGMRERKAKMDELSQAVITLPGGFGTIEEISEMLTQKQLGYNNKPLVFLNVFNYFDKLIEFYKKVIEERFAPKSSQNLFYVAENLDDAINYIKNYKIGNLDYLSEKISSKNQSNV